MIHWWLYFLGIGGWFIILIINLGLALWMLFDGEIRHIYANRLRIAVILCIICLGIAPIIDYVNLSMRHELLEVLIWSSILVGGLLPVLIALAYALVRPTLVPTGESQQEQISGEIKETDAPHDAPHDAPRIIDNLAPLAGASLVVLKGEHHGQEHELREGRNTVGRSATRSLIYFQADPSMSREHALIREEHGYFTLYDLGSTTGTFVNGYRIESPVLLQPGDVIQLGDTELRFVTKR